LKGRKGKGEADRSLVEIVPNHDPLRAQKKKKKREKERGDLPRRARTPSLVYSLGKKERGGSSASSSLPTYGKEKREREGRKNAWRRHFPLLYPLSLF